MTDTKTTPAGKRTALVACGVLRPELTHLQEQGALEFEPVLFTAPGLHDNPEELEKQLRARVEEALQSADRVVVGFGTRCMSDPTAPERNVDGILADYGDRVTRLQAGNCAEFLADAAKREEIAAGRELYWLTPGWLKYRKAVFRYFNETHKNETFGRCEAAALLCPLGTFDDLAMNDPEAILDFSDWMQLDIEPAPIDLDYFQQLLDEARRRVSEEK